MHITNGTLSFDGRNDQERGSRTTRRGTGLLRWVVLAFPLWLALAPTLAGATVLGSRATNANIPIPAGGWTTLNSLVFAMAAAPRVCTVVASADLNRPGAGTYLFTITIDDPNPLMNAGQERTVQFVAAQPWIKEVTTTQGFVLLANNAHIIRCIRQQSNGSYSNASARALRASGEFDYLVIEMNALRTRWGR